MARAAVVGCLWAAFVLCWLILAQFNKKASRTGSRAPLVLRFVAAAIVLVLLLVRRHAGPRLIGAIRHGLPLQPGPAAQWLGVGLCVVGFGFAFWARAHIGRNWGMPMSLRQDHELVTSGPYAYVRHPIYSGLMLAVFGSALALTLIWLLLFPLYFIYFIVSARTEEKMLLARFPNAYPAYRRRTRMLIPFLF